MARRKREPMSEGKKNIIGILIEEYDIKSAKDIRLVLKPRIVEKAHKIYSYIL